MSRWAVSLALVNSGVSRCVCLFMQHLYGFISEEDQRGGGHALWKAVLFEEVQLPLLSIKSR